MSTPIGTSHRNLHQRIAKLLGAKELTAWQRMVIGFALDDLQSGRHPEGESTMSMAERPDLHDKGNGAVAGAATIDDLWRRLRELATP